MHLLLVNLYEFGLFLRILLWISVPLIVVTLLVTTWLHYRSRRKAVDEVRLSMEGMDITADPADLLAAIQGRVMPMLAEGAGGVEGAAREEGVDRTAGEGSVSNEDGAGAPEESFSERERNRMYKGILWMKEKYEQYRDLADRRIEQLKDELIRSERRYQDLLDQRTEGRVPDRVEHITPEAVEQTSRKVAEQSAPEVHSPEVVDDRERLLEEKGRQLEEKDHQLESKDHLLKDKDHQLENKDHLLKDKDILLESKDREIGELQNQLKVQWQQTEELVSKLQNSSQLLLKISRELDGSLPPANQPQADPQAQAEAQPS